MINEPCRSDVDALKQLEGIGTSGPETIIHLACECCGRQSGVRIPNNEHLFCDECLQQGAGRTYTTPPPELPNPRITALEARVEALEAAVMAIGDYEQYKGTVYGLLAWKQIKTAINALGAKGEGG